MELKIKKETARQIYPTAPDYLKAILLETFGEECFKKTDFKDFETFEDLCHAIGTTETEFNSKWDPTLSDPSTIAFERLKVCTRAYNHDWKFNAYDTKQRKWYPYFEVLSSGFGFSLTLSTTLTRIRLSVRAFALNLKKKLIMQEEPSSNYLRNLSQLNINTYDYKN